MELTVEQIKAICCNIDIKDVISYINSHLLEYEEFLNKTKKNK